MKALFRLFLFISGALVGLITIIKYVQGCSWKDAVGIAEQLWKEITEVCGFNGGCCEKGTEES